MYRVAAHLKSRVESFALDETGAAWYFEPVLFFLYWFLQLLRKPNNAIITERRPSAVINGEGKDAALDVGIKVERYAVASVHHWLISFTRLRWSPARVPKLCISGDDHFMERYTGVAIENPWSLLKSAQTDTSVTMEKSRFAHIPEEMWWMYLVFNWLLGDTVWGVSSEGLMITEIKTEMHFTLLNLQVLVAMQQTGCPCTLVWWR